MTLNEQIRDIKKAETKAITDRFLEKAEKVLHIVLLELFSFDYPMLLAGQFEKRGNFPPVLHRGVVLEMDHTRSVYSVLRGKYSTRNEDLANIPNEAFLPAVISWLNEMSSEEQEEIARRILSNTDISATIKMIRFTELNGRPYFWDEIKKHYGMSDSELKAGLDSLTRNRNMFAHWSDDNFKRIKIPDVIAQTDYLIYRLEYRGSQGVKEAAKAYYQFRDENMKRLELPDLYIAQIERECQLPEGSLRESLQKKYSVFRNWMDDECRVLVFTPRSSLEVILADLRTKQDFAEEGTTQIPIFHVPLDQESVLRKYTSGKFRAEELDALVNGFSILVDQDTILSQKGQRMLSDVLGPLLEKAGRSVQIAWATLVHIRNIMDSYPEEIRRKEAKTAYHAIRFLCRKGVLRIVGDQDCVGDPRESLMALLKANRAVPVCLITADRYLAGELEKEDLPRCLCVRVQEWDRLVLYGGYHVRLMEMFHEPESMQGDATGKEVSGQLETDSVVVSHSDNLQRTQTIPDNLEATDLEMIDTTDRFLQPKPEVSRESYNTQTFPDRVPKTGQEVFDESGRECRLMKVRGQPGGEGIVYITDRKGFVAKIYHVDKLNQERYEKLFAMCSVALDIPGLCWPLSLLRNKQGQFVGYLMREAPEGCIEMARSVLKLNGEKVSQNVLPLWDREWVVICCAAVCQVFEQLHQENILVGDVNPRNILVSPDDPSKVWFVDCDSYQFGRYNCPVGMAEFSSPEMLRRISVKNKSYANCARTLTDEQFSLATLLFHMIMFGQSPFASRNSVNVADGIRDYCFYFKNDDDPGYDAPVGPYAMIWSNTGKSIKDMFADVFLGKASYSAGNWKIRFQEYQRDIASGKMTRELIPLKYPNYRGNYVDFVCDLCKNEVNMHQDKYERLGDGLKFCSVCWSFLKRNQARVVTLVCDRCGAKDQASVFQELEQQKGRKWYCGKCAEVTCRSCGISFRAIPKLIDRRNSGESVYLICPSCRKTRREEAK